MADLNRYSYPAAGRAGAGAAVDAGLRSYMQRVYIYMTAATGLSGAAAWLVANTGLKTVFFHEVAPGAWGATGLGMIAMLAPLALVFFFSFRIQRMSVGTAQGTFFLYAALVGISLASILLNFTGASVARVFFITATMFAGLSLYGYTTKRDISGWGSFLFMGLIGIIIASVVNIFIGSAAIHWVVSVIGVLVFAGLTAYDTQSIKEMYVAGEDGTITTKKAIHGALRLYLDFLNMFIMLMQLFGNRN